ncbi:hypothetical protein E4P40_26750 [Blastococcus sp. CT_GayMR20]|uniref:hypothetical protein n=1 Tax=Blastococcus sp. CT_GayMR20 TaxID=2559609 RepID=UPI0010741E80|nr:hypothetical protein [Blastococcus sp. CT_GayMR20]TFV65069.1 hypothetical protein E4P40_26750 [Blastococcus sp. CT_GayMR20]
MNPATDWIDQARGLLDLLKQGMATPPGGPQDDRHGSDCRWCPLCQAAAVARGERPEVSAALADLLTATATALRQFAEEGRPATSDAAAPSSPSAADDGPTTADHGDGSPVVQRIDIA